MALAKINTCCAELRKLYPYFRRSQQLVEFMIYFVIEGRATKQDHARVEWFRWGENGMHSPAQALNISNNVSHGMRL